jgi:CMP-N,N'-diacetyllegionaminic acid synthase
VSLTVAAVIIARAGSRRLPGKNMLPFHGRPLVAHKVAQLKRCMFIDRVVVGSDSQPILDAAAREGAVTVRRAPEYCDEISQPWNAVIADMASKVAADVIVWAHCTNPCIRPETYDRAVFEYIRKGSALHHDSLVSVCALRSHLWFRGAPLNYDPWCEPHPVAAELEPVYWQNGGIFIYDRKSMIQRRYVFGVRPLLFEIAPDEAIDIDTQDDYERALAMYQPEEATA